MLDATINFLHWFFFVTFIDFDSMILGGWSCCASTSNFFYWNNLTIFTEIFCCWYFACFHSKSLLINPVVFRVVKKFFLGKWECMNLPISLYCPPNNRIVFFLQQAIASNSYLCTIILQKKKKTSSTRRCFFFVF